VNLFSIFTIGEFEMKRSLFVIVIVTLLIILMVGCNMPAQRTPSSGDQAQTYAAETVSARLTENAATAAAGDQTTDDQQDDNQPPDTPTDTVTPSPTITPTSTPQPPTPTATESIPCNQAGWVKDVTIPDGTKFSPGKTFTKTWRLKNTGSCDWTNDYDLVFDDGDKMDGADVVGLSIGTVEPGETVDISVNLKAPNTPGDYRGEWLLRSDDNEVFGLGKNDVPFYVEIEVVEEVSFEILSVSHYTCSGKKFVTFEIENTGTKNLESMNGGVENLDTPASGVLPPSNNPFTENATDCPLKGIDDIEPGDVYYMAIDMGSASAKFEFTLNLCTQENAGGDCFTVKKQYKLP